MLGRVGLSRVSAAGGVLVVIVGLVHTAATPMIYKGLAPVVGDKAPGVAYFFAAMGVYVVLSGWLMLFCSRSLARGEHWARLVSIVNGTGNAAGGIGALAVGFANPFVWTWLLASLAVAVGAMLGAPAFRSALR